MKRAKKYFYLFLIIAYLLFVGFYRDFVFKNINYLMQAWDENLDFSMPSSLRFFENFEYSTLIKIKWVLTILFAIIYLVVSIITLKLLFNNKKYSRITIFTYIGITLVSGLFII